MMLWLTLSSLCLFAGTCSYVIMSVIEEASVD